METTSEKSSAQIQQEIEADRQRIGARIDAIQERMTPGRLVDEVLAYAKGSGGGEYLRSLGYAIKDNPIPVALMGIGLVWLMADKAMPSFPQQSTATDTLPLDYAEGRVRRIGPPTRDGEIYFSRFADESGKGWRALTDEAGRRAGHFVDEAGRTYRGFMDARGRQISEIFDEAGAALDTASGWASATWAQVKHAAGEISAKASGAVPSGETLKGRTADLNEAMLGQVRDHPLVGGALAFAMGAAIGASLPSTEQEDALMGAASDATKEAASRKAREVARQGEDMAAETLEKTVAVASDIYDAARDRVGDEMARVRERTEDAR